MFYKSFVQLYYCILKCMLNDNLNLRHQSEFTNILRNHREKPYINFISRKYYTLVFVAFTHVVYNKVYSYQLFSISINFTRKFCYWHRGKSSRIFLRKSCSKRFRKISKGLSLRRATLEATTGGVL